MEEVINSIILILRNLHEDIQDKIRELANEKNEFEKQGNELSALLRNKPHFSFLDKILFKRKKYRAYLASVRELNNKKFEISCKKNSIDNHIYEERRKADKLKNYIDNPSTVELKTIFDYFESYQEIEEYCNSKNIILTNASKLYFGKDRNDEVFMNDAISDDFRLIVFDNTYSPELYKKVIDKLNEFVKNNFDELSYKSNINLYEKMISGKYDDHFVKHIMDYLKYICSRSKTFDDMKAVINSYYLGLTQNLDRLYQKYKKENFGNILENIYENEDYVIGCHATSIKPDGDIIQDDKIFEKGIKESNKGNPRAMQFTVAYNIPFFEVLDYDQNRYGDVAGGYVYILTIPKNVVMQKEPLWGVGEDGSNYILPDFIYGKYEQISDNQKIILNSNTHKKVYDKRELDNSK